MKCSNFECKDEATKRVVDKEKDVVIFACDFHYKRDLEGDSRLKEEKSKC